MSTLKNKKVLFIGMSFYDYEECLIKYMKEQGAMVYYFSSSCYANSINKWLYRLGLIKLALHRAQKRITKKIYEQPQDIDIVFIIKGENFGKEQIELLNRKYADSQIVLYEWDSLFRLSNKDLLLKGFKNIYSFDKKDADEYGLKYRPLFYREDGATKVPLKYDVSFVGLAHDNRYQIIHKLRKQLDDSGISYCFILTTTFFKKWLGLYVTKKFAKEDRDILYTKKISYKKYIKISNSSKTILDICNPNQHGLTMRVIESIGLKKKIITTNKEISNSGISPKNYLILGVDSSIDLNFLDDNYNSSDDISKFSLSNFVNELLFSSK